MLFFHNTVHSCNCLQDEVKEVLKLKYFFTYVSVATENKYPTQCFMRQHCRYLLKLLVLGVTDRQIDGKNAMAHIVYRLTGTDVRTVVL